MAQDYYETLGVKKTDSDDTIKKAYKKLALKYHPDKASDEKTKKEYEEKFKLINEAYTTLSDKTRRQQYDMGGASFGGGRSGGFGGNQGFGGGDFADIFQNIFGGGGFGGGRESHENLDLQQSLTIEFIEAAFGCEKNILIKKNILCETCGGTGARGRELNTCGKCNGQGRMKVQQRTPWGVISQTVRCDDCRGEGRIPKAKCSVCDGDGIQSKKVKVNIKIPKGIDNGQTLRIQDGGDMSKTGRSGDLFLEIRVKPHKVFTRDRFDVHMEFPISFSQAALGDKVEIPTLSGEKIKIKIAKGTESGNVLRLKGKGIPFIDDPYYLGDQFVKIVVKTPKKLSKAQLKLFEELAKLE